MLLIIQPFKRLPSSTHSEISSLGYPDRKESAFSLIHSILLLNCSNALSKKPVVGFTMRQPATATPAFAQTLAKVALFDHFGVFIGIEKTFFNSTTLDCIPMPNKQCLVEKLRETMHLTHIAALLYFTVLKRNSPFVWLGEEKMFDLLIFYQPLIFLRYV